MLLQVPCKEEVTAEECDVLRHVTKRDVEVATLLHHGLQKQQEQVKEMTHTSHIIIIYPFNARVVGAPQMIFKPISPVLHCPLGFGELQACPFPGVVFPNLRQTAEEVGRGG